MKPQVSPQAEKPVALITGGTRGIGKAIALKLATAGTQLLLNYFRNSQAAQSTQAEIEALGAPRPLLLKANVGKAEQVQNMLEQVQDEYGRLDILISNAASGVLKPAKELSRRHLEWSMEINAYALMALTQAAAPLMPRGGRIIAISSQGATQAIENYAAVGASKAALEAYVRHLAAELAPEGLHVNAVSAGVVDTEALKHFPNREALLQNAARRTPYGRLTTPEDVAEVVNFLCSPAADMIHGQTLVVDGGYSILA